jgi:hypothetical protein
MNIQSLQEGLAQFNRETTTKASELGDQITDMRTKMSQGLTIPAVIGASSKGLKEGGKYVSNVGKRLQSTADKIDNLRGSDGLDRQIRMPTSIRNNHKVNNPSQPQEDLSNQWDDTDHFTAMTETEQRPSNYTDMKMSDRPTLQDKVNVGESRTIQPKTPDTDVSIRARRKPVLNIESETQPLETDVGKAAGQVSKVARGVGEGLESVGETGIPIVSEVADIGAGVLGVYDLFKSIGQGKKIKQEEAQKKQVEDSSPQEQVVVGGKKQQPFSVGGGNLNF